MADDYNIFIAAGDIIVTGSDGLFDNLSDKLIIEILTGLSVENFEEKLAEICQVCVAVALDENYLRVVYKDFLLVFFEIIRVINSEPKYHKILILKMSNEISLFLWKIIGQLFCKEAFFVAFSIKLTKKPKNFRV